VKQLIPFGAIHASPLSPPITPELRAKLTPERIATIETQRAEAMEKLGKKQKGVSVCASHCICVSLFSYGGEGEGI
jgi:hypothetical protein